MGKKRLSQLPLLTLNMTSVLTFNHALYKKISYFDFVWEAFQAEESLQAPGFEK